MKTILILFIFGLVIGLDSFAGTVTRAKKSTVLIKFESGEIVTQGKVYSVYDTTGELIGKVKIKKVRGKKAIGLLSKRARGKVKNGHRVEFAGKAKVVAEEVDQGPPSYNSETVNIKTNPGGALFGILNLEVDFKWSESMSVGVYLANISLENKNKAEQSGLQVGAVLNYHTNGKVFTDGMVLSAALGYLSSTFTFTDTTNGAEYEASLAGPYLGGLGAYHWYWTNWNVSLGAGLAFFTIDSEVSSETGFSEEVPVSGVQPVVDLSIGYSF